MLCSDQHSPCKSKQLLLLLLLKWTLTIPGLTHPHWRFYWETLFETSQDLFWSLSCEKKQKQKQNFPRGKITIFWAQNCMHLNRLLYIIALFSHDSHYRGPCVRKLFTGLIMYLPSQNKEHCIVLYCIVLIPCHLSHSMLLVPQKLTKMLGSCFSYRGFIMTSAENILTAFKR